MKKLSIIFVCLLMATTIMAGDGDTYFSFSGGALYKNAITAEFTFEKHLKYHSAWEVGLDYYNQIFNRDVYPPILGESGEVTNDNAGKEINRYSILFQGAYKKVLIRGKNYNIRGRLAAGIGVNDRERFTCSITPGFEYSYTFPNGVQFFVLQKNQFSFWASNKSWFRVGGTMGIKIPF
ncbi:hypothetical protein [Parabacteroides sp. PF5-9]|uniref:hypothetical protein n=1 Tax=Parabacteroides sp. PF5-9 TaxID=1742404 RepID=UPI0024739B29|nr:hypothetical protein [Parabacteroides sp. PF5-9]MDH6358921.1 hypothetical protein [Parabacteroides sp. PF5-9]